MQKPNRMEKYEDEEKERQNGHKARVSPRGEALIPDLQKAVPRSRGYRHSIFGNSKAADAIVVTSQDT